jgi:integrative and conjugative element protein (TIGR02256 family)
METWQSESRLYTVVLEGEFLSRSVRLAREHLPNEVGTALYGHYSDDGRVAHVSGLGPLAPDSRGARFSFLRGIRGLQGFFAKLFWDTSGKIHYVGEWHSHPNGAPHPSGTDDENMMAIARDQQADCPEAVLVILGVTPESVSRSVYVYSRARGRVALRYLGG